MLHNLQIKFLVAVVTKTVTSFFLICQIMCPEDQIQSNFLPNGLYHKIVNLKITKAFGPIHKGHTRNLKGKCKKLSQSRRLLWCEKIISH